MLTTQKPDALDLTNLYQNNGYLFSTINPVEVSADGNVIDLEIRILEGKPAYFNKISVTGNEKQTIMLFIENSTPNQDNFTVNKM